MKRPFWVAWPRTATGERVRFLEMTLPQLWSWGPPRWVKTTLGLLVPSLILTLGAHLADPDELWVLIVRFMFFLGVFVAPAFLLLSMVLMGPPSGKGT